ncbi:MAG: adenylate kinase [Erysipelotrichaceae bacterium]|nr:adenylate kinase [Erysipelotrichaceae bacterium]
MNLLIIGAPGAGKGTMSDLIKKEYGVVHVSTGDMLREAVRKETPVGLKAQGYMNRGELVPDEIIHEIIAERLSADDIQRGFLFDGYPRTRVQAEDLDAILNELGLKLDCVIDLAIDDEVLTKRITGRRICKTCGEIFNVYYNPPKVEGICDRCGKELSQRKDDNIESLTTRLAAYHAQTQPVIEYYRDIVKEVNADQSIDDVFNDIKEVLGGLL